MHRRGAVRPWRLSHGAVRGARSGAVRPWRHRRGAVRPWRHHRRRCLWSYRWRKRIFTTLIQGIIVTQSIASFHAERSILFFVLFSEGRA